MCVLDCFGYMVELSVIPSCHWTDRSLSPRWMRPSHSRKCFGTSDGPAGMMPRWDLVWGTYWNPNGASLCPLIGIILLGWHWKSFRWVNSGPRKLRRTQKPLRGFMWQATSCYINCWKLNNVGKKTQIWNGDFPQSNGDNFLGCFFEGLRCRFTVPKFSVIGVAHAIGRWWRGKGLTRCLLCVCFRFCVL